MIKRVTWFVAGVAAGAGAVVLMGRRIKRRVADLAPVRVVERTFDRTKSTLGRVKVAVTDGRAAMNEREEELRDRMLGSKGVESGTEETVSRRSRSNQSSSTRRP